MFPAPGTPFAQLLQAQGCPRPSAAALGGRCRCGFQRTKLCFACGQGLTVSTTQRQPSAGGRRPRHRRASQEHGTRRWARPPPGTRTRSPCRLCHSGARPGPPRPRGAVRAGKRAVRTRLRHLKGHLLAQTWCCFLFLVLSQKGDCGAESWPHTSPGSWCGCQRGAPGREGGTGQARGPQCSHACDLSLRLHLGEKWPRAKLAPQISRGRAGVDVWLPR